MRRERVARWEACAMETKARRQVRRRLEELRRELEQTREATRQWGFASGPSSALSELSAYDNHPADLGTETWQQAQQAGAEITLSRRLDDVQGALERLEEGTYGLCARCGHSIPAERLEARPEAEFCLYCQEQVEEAVSRASPDRPLEEGLIPGRGGAAPTKVDDPGWDGEDVWQAVARHGTSNTPSDVPGASYPEVTEDAGDSEGTVQDVERFSDRGL